MMLGLRGKVARSKALRSLVNRKPADLTQTPCLLDFESASIIVQRSPKNLRIPRIAAVVARRTIAF